jgi:acetyl-CoA C-acetyltransferase
MAMKEVFIVSACRTPIGSLGGILSSVPAPRLGAVAVRAALQRAGVSPGVVDEVYLGNVLTAGEGQAPARQAAIYAGIPTNVPCTTVNKVCASGMKAVMLAAQSIGCGAADAIVAGGMESMSNVPYYLAKARKGYRLGHDKVIDGIIYDGLWDPYGDMHMGVAGEVCAAENGLSREEQDAWCAESYRRATRAWEEGLMQREVVAVETGGKTPVTVTEDEEYRRVDYGKIGQLKPVFQEGGTITAANASKINDGAAALLLVSGDRMRELGLRPLARIVSFADASQDPVNFTTTPHLAVNKALARAGLAVEEMDYAEINEAFSCVAMVNERKLGIPHERMNVWGGAVSLGHPLGCSGARILVTLIHILEAYGGRYGVAGICNGGGGASAMVIERGGGQA